MNRVEKALENHSKGYNCAQSVACAFCDMAEMSEKDIFRIMEGFGAGMGGMQCTCGAVSGAIALAGLKHSLGNENPITKKVTYADAKQIIETFTEKNGSVICCELKGLATGQPLRSCNGCIEDAVVIAEKLLFSEE